MSTRRRGSGSIYKQPRCGTWTIAYYRRGKRIRESTHTAKYAAARALLNARLGAIARGTYVEPDRNPILVSECYEMLRARYQQNNLRSADSLATRWKHVEPRFGNFEAQCVSETALDEYVSARLKEGAASGTINRELSCLKASFRIAYAKRRLQRVPVFPHLKEANPRSGFVEDGDYARLAANAGSLWARTFMEMAYTFGLRKSELLDLRVRQCNLLERTISMDARRRRKAGLELRRLAKFVQPVSQCNSAAGRPLSNIIGRRRCGNGD
jgi:hypothetical protein